MDGKRIGERKKKEGKGKVRGGQKRGKKEPKREKKKKRIGIKLGSCRLNHLAEREREKKKGGKKKKKSSPQNSNLGPLKRYRPIRLQLILRDISRYAYNSEGVLADTLKGPGENTEGICNLLSI